MSPEKLDQGYYKQTGTVLKRRDSSREGQSLLLFMRGFGPRWVNAPGASSKNRFGGATEPLVWGEYSLYQSPSALYLKGAEVREDFLSLRRSPGPLLTALRLYRTVASESPLNCENDALLRLLWSTMVQLRDGAPHQIVEFRALWKTLANFGVAPSLEFCSQCGAKLTEGRFTADGLLCESCARGSGRRLQAGELAELRCAALLPHEQFINWSKLRQKINIFDTNIEKLYPYFRNLR